MHGFIQGRIGTNTDKETQPIFEGSEGQLTWWGKKRCSNTISKGEPLNSYVHGFYDAGPKRPPCEAGRAAHDACIAEKEVC